MKRGMLDGLEIDSDVVDGVATEPTLKPGELLCCSNGCGETDAISVWVPVSETLTCEAPNRTTEITLQPVWVSRCCRGAMFFYRESDGAQRDCE